MNIWVIGRSYPQKSNNMQGSFELEQAKMLAKHGHKVSYLACVFHPFKKVKKWGYCSWSEDNLNIFTCSQIYAIERMKLHLKGFQSLIWKKLLSQVETKMGTPDVIHVHYPANITIADTILEYKKKGTKIVCTEHWSQVLNNTIDQYETKQLNTYVKNADVFICVSPTLKQAVKKICDSQNNIFVVPNIVNDLFKPVEKQDNKFSFIVVGVLFPNKQFDKVIEAFSTQFKDQDNIELIVVGDGPESDRLHKLAVELGVKNQVVFCGKLPRQDTANMVGNSDCLICYSLSETFGVPIIESWACGSPVIASTAAAVREGWDEKLGIQVSPDNLVELENAMKYVYENYSQYDQEYIRSYSVENYSENKVYSKLISIYS